MTAICILFFSQDDRSPSPRRALRRFDGGDGAQRFPARGLRRWAVLTDRGEELGMERRLAGERNVIGDGDPLVVQSQLMTSQSQHARVARDRPVVADRV